MKVLLVNPNRTGTDIYNIPPMHLVCIAQVVNKCGHSSEIFDVPFLRAKRLVDLLADQMVFEESMISEILEKDFDILGIGGIVSGFSFSKKLVTRCKEVNPEVPIIIGGSLGIPNVELWQDRTGIDYLVEADGDLVMEKFLAAYPDNMEKLFDIPGLWCRGEDGRFIPSAPDLPADLDYLDFPDWSLLDNLEEQLDQFTQYINNTLPAELKLAKTDRFLPILMTRGCPFRCTFCYHSSPTFRKHSIDYVIRFLKHVKVKYGITHLATWDDLIITHRKWFAELCDEIAKQDLGLTFYGAGGKPNLMRKDLVDSMKRAGFFRFSFGVESGSQEILDIMKKRATVEDNLEAVRMTARAGIYTMLNMMLGMPGENKSTLKDTSKFLVTLAKDGVINSRRAYFSYATGYPGTELYDWIVDRGFITDSEIYLKNQTGLGGYPFPLSDVTLKEMHRFKNITRLKMDFYYNRAHGYHFKAVVELIKDTAFLIAGELLPRSLRQRILEMLRERS